MKFQDIKNKTQGELEQTLASNLKDLRARNFGILSSKDVMSGKKQKKDIARLLTAIASIDYNNQAKEN